MPMYFDFESRPRELSPPSEQAHKANRTAMSALDATESHSALEQQIRRDAEHPIQQKCREAFRSRKVLLCGFLTVCLFPVVYWEWGVSREIYTMWFPAWPWLPFVSCVAVAFYISACLAESSSHFSLFTSSEPTGGNNVQSMHHGEDDQLYGRKRKNKREYRWVIHPFTGALLAVAFLSGIYIASRIRVELQREAGEAADGAFQIYLPVVLYLVDIILGISAFFFIVCCYNFMRMKRQRLDLARARDGERNLQHTAIQGYFQYVEALREYNERAQQSGGPEAILINPNQALRQLLIQEFGYDPTAGNAPPAQRAARPLDPISPAVTEVPTRPSTPPTEDRDGRVNQDEGSEDRLDELTSLLDEQINYQNRGI